MIERKKRYDLPRSADEAANLLVSDLMTQEMDILSHMNEDEFNQLYASVAEYILDDFKIWAGNDELLYSCLTQAETEAEKTEPAWVILRKVREQMADVSDVVIVT